jgi:hypothetical protein
MARAAGQFGRRPGAPLALAIYLVAALVLLGAPLLSHPGRDCLCIVGTRDEAPTAWALAWWPHALVHGLNPFFPKLIYAPRGIDIAQGAMLPGLALALAPVTALAGPLFSYNLAALLGPPVAAFFAFLLCRRLIAGRAVSEAPADTRPARVFWPALVGGWLFGFSTYMFAQETGHLNLALVFLVPAIGYLAIRAFAGELRPRRFAVLLTMALVAQFSLSVEVFATLTLFGAIGLALAWLLGTGGARRSLRAMLTPIGAAYLLTAVVVSPYLYYALKPGGEPILPARTGKYSNDLLGFVLPTQITRVGGLHFLGTTVKFTAGYVEGAAYLGAPLLVLVVIAVLAGRRRAEIRWLGGMLLIAVVLSLGAHLHIDGSSSVPLPWALVDHLPLVGIVLPSRLVMFATLFVAVLAASGLAGCGARARKAASKRGSAARVAASRYLPWALAAAAVLSLWPAVNIPFWHSHPDQPRLFTTSAYRKVIGPRDNVLVLPIGIYGLGMLWQAQAHLSFNMAGGYVVPPEAPDPYKAFAIYPTLAYNAVFPHVEFAAENFIKAERITVAVLSVNGAALSVWPRLLTGLGWHAIVTGGAIVFRPARAAQSH